MKSAKTMVIVASVVFLTLSLAGHSAGKETPTPKLVAPTPKFPELAAPAPNLPELVAPAPKLPKLIAPAPKLPKLTAPAFKLPKLTAPAPKLTAPAFKLPKLTAPAFKLPKLAAPIPVRIKPVEEPHKESVIMLEAFMVQVRLSALRSLGVPQISQGSDSVSADHILKLLKDTDAAVVTAGAKLALGQAGKAKTDLTARKRIYTGPPEKKKTEYVNVGTSFTAVVEVRREKKIFAELEFEHNSIEEGDVEAGPGTLVQRNWSVSLYLEPDKPTLVGAIQDVHTAAFLVVTAGIKK